jgi:hypothetical protein
MVNMGEKMGPKKGQHSMRAVFSFWRVLWRRFVKRQKLKKEKKRKKAYAIARRFKGGSP